MANLTVTIDDDLLQRARIRALREKTSVNALLREYLQAYAGERAQREMIADDLLSLASEFSAGSGGKRWTRDELHER